MLDGKIPTLRRRDSYYTFFDHFGDPDGESPGQFPDTTYPSIKIDATCQIRVVDLLPGAFDDPVKCRLSVRSLTDHSASSGLRQDYTALSYSWGGFVEHASVQLNDVLKFPVSKNLWCALKRLRSADTVQTFWIDQMSINQHDMAERQLQVPLMDRVYTQAKDVIIWLGDAAPGIDLTGVSVRHQLDRTIEFGFKGRKNLSLCWYKRLWCLQEFCLAHSMPSVQFGNCNMSWDEVCKLAAKYSEDAQSYLEKAKGFSIFEDMAHNFSETRKVPPADRTIFAFWWIFPQLLCFSPHDKIYGLMGVLPKHVRDLIDVNYTREVAETYAQATHAEISATKSLAILSMKRANPTTQTLPSWSADFDFPNHFDWETLTVPSIISQWRELFSGPPRSWTVKSPQVNAEISFDTTSRSLTIQALEFDTVVLAIPIASRGEKDRLWEPASANKMTLAATSLGRRMLYKSEERRFRDAVLKPLDDGVTSFTRLSKRQNAYPKSISKLDSSLRRFVAESLAVDWLVHEIHDDIESMGEELEDEKWPWAFYKHMDSVFADPKRPGCGVSFFVTSTGFIGFSLDGTQVGDQVALPLGGHLPVLLRRQSDVTWKFMNFVYVVGLAKDQLKILTPELDLPRREYCLV